MNLIGINGYIGSGKDTVGTMIQYHTSHPDSINKTDSKNRSYNSFLIDVGVGYEPTWKIKKFAGKLKQIVSLLTGIPVDKFEDQEFKRTSLGEEWSKFPEFEGKTLSELREHEEKCLIWGASKMTVRELLQRLGTDAIRNKVHPNAWINALFADYKPNGFWMDEKVEKAKSMDSYLSYPKWIITDVRFPNEAQAIKNKGGIIVRVNRNDAKRFSESGQTPHISEMALDEWNFDYTIDNYGNMNYLVSEVGKMIKHFNIK